MATIGHKLYGKIYSLEPNAYKLITAEKAIRDYTTYLKAVNNSQYDNNLEQAKTLSEWLETEI